MHMQDHCDLLGVLLWSVWTHLIDTRGTAVGPLDMCCTMGVEDHDCGLIMQPTKHSNMTIKLWLGRQTDVVQPNVPGPNECTFMR